MSAIARGALPPIAVMLALASVPVWISALSDRQWDSCRDPAALAETEAISGSIADPLVPLPPSPMLLRVSGRLRERTPGGGELLYWLVRSMDASRVYDQPTFALNMPLDPDETQVRWIDIDGERVPIHVAISTFNAGIHVAAYLMEYDNRPIERLLPVQMATAIPQLLHGTRPITLYIVDGIAREGRPEEVSEPATAWIIRAWRRHRKVCGP